MQEHALAGKVALITGATRGLGRAMADAFARAGADIAVVSRKAQACESTARELTELGVRARAFPCHVGRWDEISPMAQAAWDHFGRIDVLVNNAGMSPLYPSLDAVTEQNFDKVVGVNFKGPFRLTALVGGWMHAGAGGSVINVSSVASLQASPYALPYAGAKAALNALTDGFAAAYSPNVRVNTLCVGPFATDVAEHWPDPPDHGRPGWTKGGWRVGLPSELIAAAVYLASDASSFTNAALLRIDGGPVRARRPEGVAEHPAGGSV
ncbi:MAG TPA: SDR family oxidoreductase [Caulobacteraceae bacterium]|jgi:NAD(P)-dependent dehydrogenase (short-subunit alcohol dehydrogenase family)|nr:SDR family oxidoreductase [Caulobacteraceae bacterium]